MLVMLKSRFCWKQPPRQVVTPYKPSEDLEQVPLINPNSPSHLACTSPYPLLKSRHGDNACDEVDLAYGGDSVNRSQRKAHLKSVPELATSKNILNKVKSATLGRSHKAGDVSHTTAFKADEVHEYHEISDTDTESMIADNARADNTLPLESPGIPKSYGDFSQSLLDEMESMFRSLDGRGRREETSASGKHFDFDTSVRSNTYKTEKKKNLHTGTMKQMSAQDEKTLETAMTMANEITTKSMNDLDSEPKLPRSPSDRSKFHFKFPLVSKHHTLPHDSEKDLNGKQERRNFSEEAHSVPDIQATISEESKLAYTSLIEEPTPCSSLMSHMAIDATIMRKPSTIPKPAPRVADRANFYSLQKQLPYNNRPSSRELNKHELNDDNNQNVLPLPPRATKPKLVDKPRHIRKYPLKLPPPTVNKASINGDGQTRPTIIYQNAVPNSVIKEYIKNRSDTNMLIRGDKGRDVVDSNERLKVDTNPFTSSAGPSSVNPFNCYLVPVDDGDREPVRDRRDEQYFEEGSLVKDHVSVEDLLEFADQKPCGRQRGVESDEVRIMNKVLKNQVKPEECLEALELSEWNVHGAIKLIRVKIAVEGTATLEDCSKRLAEANGDIMKASAVLVLCNKQN